MSLAALVDAHPATPIFLLCRATSAASVFFQHLLLNTIWFPLQSGHFSSVWQLSDPCFAVHPTPCHLWSLVRWWPEQQPHFGLLPHLFSMWPHPQQSSNLLSGSVYVYLSTRYHTPASSMPVLKKFCATLLPFTMKTTDDAAISAFCLLSLMVQGFASDHTWVGLTIPSFTASNFSRIFCRRSVPFPMYHLRGTAWIVSCSTDSFSSTSTTPSSTVLTAVMMMSRYCRAISAVAFGCVIAEIAPLAFLLALMILMWAGAFLWKSALLIADAISWSILLESSTLSSLLNMRRVSAILDPAVGAVPGPGLTGALWLLSRGGTVSHRLAGVGADFGLGADHGLGCSLSCRLGFGFWCSCWSFSGLPSRVVSACCDASSSPPSVLAVILLSFCRTSWPGATPFMTFAIMFVMPAPHSLSSSWQASHFCSLSCIHAIIPCHCVSSQAARDCHRLASCWTFWCSCISFCDCCRIVLSIRLLQSLGATAVARA